MWRTESFDCASSNSAESDIALRHLYSAPSICFNLLTCERVTTTTLAPSRVPEHCRVGNITSTNEHMSRELARSLIIINKRGLLKDAGEEGKGKL